MDLKQVNHLHYIYIDLVAKVFSLVSCNPCAKLSRGEVGLGGEGGAGEARQGGEGGAGEGEGAISVPVAGC